LQRLVAMALEDVLQLDGRELPQPGRGGITELFEIGGAFTPCGQQTCGMLHSDHQCKRPQHAEVRLVCLEAPLGRGLQKSLSRFSREHTRPERFFLRTADYKSTCVSPPVATVQRGENISGKH